MKLEKIYKQPIRNGKKKNSLNEDFKDIEIVSYPGKEFYLKKSKKPNKKQIILGTHWIIEYYECDPKVLTNEKKILEYMLTATKKAKATIIAHTSHKLGQGVSVVIVVAESHLSIHTWPEYKYAAVDIFTCGKTNPEKAFEYLKKALVSEKYIVNKTHRGVS